MKKFTFIMFVNFMVVFIFTLMVQSTSLEVNALNETIDQSNVLKDDRYTTILKSWDLLEQYTGDDIVYTPSDYIVDESNRVPHIQSNNYRSDVVDIQKGDTIKLTVSAPIAGLYTIQLDYFDYSNSLLAPEAEIKINGEYPYYEARSIVFPMIWEHDIDGKEVPFKTDRYDNELAPKAIKVKKWQTNYVMDGSYIHSTPLNFNLKAGENEILLTTISGTLLVGDIRISSPIEHIDYATYKSQYQESNKVEQLLKIEAEIIEEKSDPSVRLYSDRDPASKPYHTTDRKLNAIDGESWRKPGQSVSWKVNVPETGLYKIGFKYMQATLVEMPVYRSIKIDGEIPFQELENYAFKYTKNWRNEVLGNSEEDFYFYLTKGEHSVTLTATMDPYRQVTESIQQIMNEINDLALDIKKLTGNKIDKYRDWKLTEYIPDVEDRLITWAEEIEMQYDYADSLSSKKSSGEIINLKIAASILRDLAKKPDELPNRISDLSEGTSSINQLLGDQMLRLYNQNLGLEKIYFFNQEALPDARAGFFVRMWEGIKRFTLSFFENDYADQEVAEDEIEIWVNRPRQYVEIMQKMVDEEFTEETGIKVKLSLMPNENKLILANAAGTQPDVAMGVNHWLPYELALRGAALDLRDYEGYEELVSNYAKGAMIPYVYEDGVYGVPETQDFWVTYYRTDILNKLDVPVPETWEEVVGILPELQRYGLNYFEPLSMYEGFKPFVATLPFMYQYGVDLYSEDGMRAEIDSEESVEAIKFMTDLFKIYDLPERAPNFYQHFRYGTMPIGIANSATYLQLQVAAPEIQGNWDITLHPGRMNEDGVVERWAPVGGQGITIFKETEHAQESFDFIKWWMSTEVQTDFAYTLTTMYGEEFLWVTSNLEAFNSLPLPEDHKEVILEQWEWAVEASRVPGAYMVEREISNSWNKIVFNGANPRITIDRATITANREIRRKMEEFGYIKDGQVVKPYRVPTIYNIDEWLTER